MAIPLLGGASMKLRLVLATAAADGCKLAQEFKPGGTVDGMFDSWKLNGSVLTVGMMGETRDMSVKVIDQNTMEAQIAGANMHRLTRC